MTSRETKAKSAYFRNNPDLLGERVSFPEVSTLERLNKRDKEWAAKKPRPSLGKGNTVADQIYHIGAQL
jgi:hypothetical protein